MVQSSQSCPWFSVVRSHIHDLTHLAASQEQRRPQREPVQARAAEQKPRPAPRVPAVPNNALPLARNPFAVVVRNCCCVSIHMAAARKAW